MKSANKVLIVEPKSIDGAYLKLLLEKQGWKADVVSNGYDVTKKMETRQYAIMFISRNFSDMDGLEVVRNIRNWESKNGENIFLVGLTSSSIAEERKAMYAAGVNYCVNKPVYGTELTEALAIFNSDNRRLSIA